MLEARARENLANLTERFCEATGASKASVGQRALNDNTFVPRVVEGDTTCTLRTYDRVLQWFSDNWPSSTRWPRGIERPAATEKAA